MRTCRLESCYYIQLGGKLTAVLEGDLRLFYVVYLPKKLVPLQALAYLSTSLSPP
jgi:hypothetical protein